MPKILAFAGSTRTASWNKKLIGVAAESARQGALDAGATFYVLKPDIGKLIEAVNHVTCGLLPEGCESGRVVRPLPRHAEP